MKPLKTGNQLVSRPLVTVVVTTRNEEQNIGNCLRSVLLQDYPSIEVIVVDNNSNDDTKKIAQSFSVEVFNYGPERSAQRNFGLIQIGSGKYGMYIDADMILTPSLVGHCVEEMESNEVFGLHIEETILGGARLSKIRRFERSFYTGTVIDGIRFFTISNFRLIGGFDEKLMPGPEDWDLDKRMKQFGKLKVLGASGESLKWPMSKFIEDRGIFHKDTFVGIYHNEDEINLKMYIGKKVYYSKSMENYISKWGRSDRDIKRQMGFVYRYVYVFCENGKWKKILRHPVLFFQVLVLRIIVGMFYIYTTKGIGNSSR